MKLRLLPLAIVAALMLGACQESPSETAKDVSDARKEAASNISDARQDSDETMTHARGDVIDARKDYAQTEGKAMDKLTGAEADAMIESAHANFDVARAEIEGRYQIESEKCGALGLSAKAECLTAAEAIRDQDMAAAARVRDEILEKAEYHDTSTN